MAMPDVHSGYGFSIGNVAAFDMSDPTAVVSPGGVGFGERGLVPPTPACCAGWCAVLRLPHGGCVPCPISCLCASFVPCQCVIWCHI